ncbi:flagellar protein FlaG [Guyparkeria halopsychrophila]|uniref:flagellar protein FlaG n=1 Tax=Guyparkeria halopsychrophila TaxID=3139421 RepID=UPI0037C7EBC6
MSDISASNAFGKMPSLYAATARTAQGPAPGGERSVESGRQVNVEAANSQGGKNASLGAAETASSGLDREALEQKLDELSEIVQGQQRDLSFTVDDDTGRTVVKVINSQTEEVVRQIPMEEVLEIARRIESGEGGMLKLEA